MAEIVVTEADLDKSVRELVERARRSGTASPVAGIGAGAAVHVLRVPDSSGVLFHPSGPARIGGYNHLGLELED